MQHLLYYNNMHRGGSGAVFSTAAMIIPSFVDISRRMLRKCNKLNISPLTAI